eukprot:gb/GECH01013728.1/.p1 GENE.gb/GECH01013728.1/~~gb/GECH01013728.1/.p1  ORF type:complete len:422 (+),score=96.69 gb/GECH01013728.1/:1-1266(+)
MHSTLKTLLTTTLVATLGLVNNIIPSTVAQSSDTGNGCFDYSWASYAAPKLKTALDNMDSIPTDPNGGVSTVYNVTSTLTSHYWVNLYYGLSDGKFFMTKNCDAIEMKNNQFCQMTDDSIIAYVRHDSYNDNLRHVFRINSADGTLGTELGTEDDAYDTTGRFWYQLGGGWSERFAWASGGSGVVNTIALDDSNGVIGADRPNREPCGPQLSNSYVIPAAKSLAALPQISEYHGTTRQEDIQQLFSLMLNQAVQPVDRGYVFNVYFAMGDSNNFYMIKDCETGANQDADGCSDTDTRYTAWVRNEGYFGDQQRHVFALTEDGDVDMDNELLAQDYVPNQRPWYTIEEGYSPRAYEFSSNGEGRSYSQPMMGGVASADYVSTEPETGCSGSGMSNSDSGASSLYLSSGVLTIAIISIWNLIL